MTDQDTRRSTDNGPPEDAAARPGDPAQAAADQSTAPAPKPSTSLDRELAETKDRLLRTLAEMENLRRRTEREVADARTYGITAFARDILTVADNMHRALHALDEELRAKADSALKALLDGVELTERELMNALEKHGVTRIDPQGQKFDPNRHQAMYEVEDASVPNATVAQVIQAGYLIGERVLRPAMVAVSKGGPKTAPQPAAEAPANDNSGAK
jgi:molecular chaperone GrpE